MPGGKTGIPVARTERDKGRRFLYCRMVQRKSGVSGTDYPLRPGLAWLGLAWLGLAWLGLAWLGLAAL